MRLRAISTVGATVLYMAGGYGAMTANGYVDLQLG